ncbi:MAG: hypothetical protein AB1796_00240 [Bacillota bacterium]
MPRKHLQDIETEQYVYGHGPAEADRDIVEDCSEGINPFGAPPGLLEVFSRFGEDDLRLYPDLLANRLRKALCDYWGDTAKLDEDEVFFAPGSLGVLERIKKFMFDAGDCV